MKRISGVTGVVIISLLFGGACRHQRSSDESTPMTDLVDNREVAAAFAAFKEATAHCPVPDRVRENTGRVIVTGFGLFGSQFNISGIVAMSMSNPDFWPSEVNLRTSRARNSAVFRHGDVQTKHGVYLLTRDLTIDDHDYQVCFLLLDVKWDLAAAIILHEAGIFKPDLVIMGGMNGREPTAAYFETGAVNEATLSTGFTAEGHRLPTNVPAGGDLRVLQSLPADHLAKMTWDAELLAQRTEATVAAISRNVTFSTRAAPIRRDNDYICNNVSFAVTSGLTGQAVALAGGAIRIPAQNTGAKVGFLHYPYQASVEGRADHAEEVFGWTKLLASIIRITLP